MLDYRSIMADPQGSASGRKSPLAAVIRGGLWMASLPYRSVVTVRNRRFDQGSSEIHRCGVPVISVGNLTTGGTGKTPVVCMLARWLREQDVRVAIVSRGYGRGDRDNNDEAMELHARLPDVPHVQDPDRVAAAEVAVNELDCQVVLMDDGFQHRRLHRDLDIVVVDAKCPFGYGHLLPRGLLREPISSLRRADLVMLTRCQSVANDRLDAICSEIASANRAVPQIRSNHQPSRLLEYPDRETSIETLSGKRVAVVSAIGNPEAFEETVRLCKAEVVDARRLPDHDPYSPQTVAALRSWARSLDGRVDQIVCTHKDLVKLKTDRLAGIPMAAIVIDLQLLGDASALEQALQEKILAAIPKTP